MSFQIEKCETIYQRRNQMKTFKTLKVSEYLHIKLSAFNIFNAKGGRRKKKLTFYEHVRKGGGRGCLTQPVN